MVMNTATDRVYEDFDPVSDLVSEENCDTFILYLPGFKKEQLKVQLTTSHILRIMGERPIGDGKWRRFHKEFKISPNVNTKEITAKFEGGILQIRQPKLIISEAPKPQAQPVAPSPQPQPEKKNDGFVTPPTDFPGSHESEAKEETKDEKKEDSEASRKEDEIPSKGVDTETKCVLPKKQKLAHGRKLITELRKSGTQKTIGAFVLLSLAFLAVTLLGLYIFNTHTELENELQSVIENKNQGFQGPSPT